MTDNPPPPPAAGGGAGGGGAGAIKAAAAPPPARQPHTPAAHMDQGQLLLLGGGLLVAAALVYYLKRSATAAASTSSSPPSSSPTGGGVFLNKKRQSVRLAARTDVTHDTVLLRFALPAPDMRLGLPCGKHFKVFCPNPRGAVAGQWNGRADPEEGRDEIERKYTPISGDSERGFFELLIKVYRPQTGTDARFVDGGKASRHFDALRVGDALEVQGPFGLVEYKGCGVLEVRRKLRTCTTLAMAAGGSGITPMLQVLRAALADTADTTVLHLLYANQTPDDILLRDELDALAERHPGRFHLHYTVDRVLDRKWAFSTGFVDEAMLRAHFPPPAPDGSLEVSVLMCGPPPMLQYALRPNLDKIGFSKVAPLPLILLSLGNSSQNKISGISLFYSRRLFSQQLLSP